MFIIKVYFSSSSKGESRCFQINTNDLVDSRLIDYIKLKKNLWDFDIVFKLQIYLKLVILLFWNKECASKPCLNDSYCHTKSSGNFQCHCRDGFWGTRCENGTSLVLFICLFRGFWGVFCVFCFSKKYSLLTLRLLKLFWKIAYRGFFIRYFRPFKRFFSQLEIKPFSI